MTRPWAATAPIVALLAWTAACTPPIRRVEAASVRFRPIMMTTFAALTGALPIALGAGSESRRPLGVAVVGGHAFSQFVTLYVTPVFYMYFDELPAAVSSWWRRWRRQAGGVSPEPAHGD